MYEELIKRLRTHVGWTLNKTLDEAADAIEKLQRAVKLLESDRDAERILRLAAEDKQWHKITTRPMDDDERKEWSERLGFELDDDEAVIYSNLPDDLERVLIYSSFGGINIDTFYDDEGCYFEDNGDMDGITHWMHLPAEPPKEANNG